MMLKMYVILFLQLLLLQNCHGSPFLYNVASILTSASGSSSASQRNENIADLRKVKETGYLSKQEVAPADQNDNEFSFGEDPQTNNGVVPSIIQKKVTKLLRKLAFITMFANSGNKPTTIDEDFNSDKDEFDKDFEEDHELKNRTEMINNTTSINNSTSLSDFDEVVSPNEIILFDENGRVESVAKDRRKSNMSGDIKSQKQQEATNKAGFFRFSPNDIGLFFIEALASVAGIAYGLIAQSNVTFSRLTSEAPL